MSFFQPRLRALTRRTEPERAPPALNDNYILRFLLAADSNGKGWGFCHGILLHGVIEKTHTNGDDTACLGMYLCHGIYPITSEKVP